MRACVILLIWYSAMPLWLRIVTTAWLVVLTVWEAAVDYERKKQGKL